MFSLPTSTSIPFHQPMFSDFFSKLSPIQPEIGKTGVFFSMNSFFHPTFTSMDFISLALSTRWWCISTVNTLPVHGFEAVWVGKKTTSSPGFTTPCSTRPASTSPTPLIL